MEVRFEDVVVGERQVGSEFIRKKGFGPEETQVALGVSRDSKDIKD